MPWKKHAEVRYEEERTSHENDSFTDGRCRSHFPDDSMRKRDACGYWERKRKYPGHQFFSGTNIKRRQVCP